MGADSKIAWTHHTYNPWWGCEKVSAACRSCYAEAFAKRTGHAVWGGDNSPRRFFGDKHWEEPIKWNRAAEKAGERHRVFCASMADVFEARDDLDPHRARLWELIEATPRLDWLLLTKRPEELMQRIPERWRDGLPASVWVGTTVENQEMANARIPHLLRVPARVRFLSCEPLLEHLTLDDPACSRCWHQEGWRLKGRTTPYCFCFELHGEAPFSTWLDPSADEQRPGINWVILGGESGGNARPFDLQSARDVLKQCQDREVATFIKQLGSMPMTDNDDDRRLVGDMMIPGRFRLRQWDRSGGDPAEWPEDLQVRQFPEVSP